MKKRNVFLTAAALALVLAGCFSPYTGDNGSITIALGGTSRVLVNPDTELASMRHEITLRGPGGTITRTVKGGGSLTVEAAPGNWTVKVRARGPQPDFYSNVEVAIHDFPTDSEGHILRALGETSVTVKSGAASSAEINMITATEVSNWEQLKTVINFANTVESGGNPTVPREEIIVLNNDMDFEADLASLGAETAVLPTGGGKIITLMADWPVTVTRTTDSGSFFRINDGTLTLGRPGMTGTITFDGGWGGGEVPGFLGASFVNITLDGLPFLVMNDGVTLTNNNSSMIDIGNGGFGGAVFVDGGSFTMNGGTISNNFAEAGMGGGVYIRNGKFTMDGGFIRGNRAGISNDGVGYGAGVYIYRTLEALEDAHFIKTGGTIYGNEAEAGTDANTMEDDDGLGAAVYYAYDEQDPSYGDTNHFSKYRESTLYEYDRLSTNDLAAGWETAQ